jgi:hypothetical protein
MEILILAGLVVVGALIYFNRSSKSLDINNDGKVDSADLKAAAKNAVSGVKRVADVDGDGKVTAKDAKAAAGKAKTAVKKTAAKAKTAAKRVTTRKKS